MHDFWHYLTWGYLWAGARTTLEISAASLVGSVVLGVILAEARLSRVRPLRWTASTYIWIVRGTPLLLQLLFLFDALPSIGIVLSPIPTAIIGFSLNEGAFFGEIIRGGIASVSRSQILAAESLGMSPRVTRRRVVAPQALRAILPSLGNEFIALIKGTSLASVIAVNELTQRAQYISSQTFVYFPVFSAAAIIYLVLTTAASGIQTLLERRFDLERSRVAPVSELNRWFGIGILGPLLRRSVVSRSEAEEPTPEAVAPPPRPTLVAVPDEPRAIASGATKDAFVSCVAVWKRYKDVDVLKGVDLEVRRGEVVSIMGGSGSGKSTLLRLISHLDALDDGQIRVDGQSVGYDDLDRPLRSGRRLASARAEAHIGFVFQSYNLIEHMSVLENVTAAPTYVHGADRRVARAKARGILEQVGLSQHADKLPHQLSGGQQQRVAIARSLAIEPKLILFDEPTSALDPELVGEVLATMRMLADSGMTMIVVTHEVRFALDVADKIVFLDQGRVVEQGAPTEVLRNPQQPQTQRFLSSMPAIA